METFFRAFVPIFVAVDPLGLMPLYLALTEGIGARQRRQIAAQACLTALIVALGFMLVGKELFAWLGITANDFLVAGGVLLFLIATLDLVSGQKLSSRVGAVGAVPLGVPLIVGPAVLTTSLMLVGEYGPAVTGASLTANILVTGLVLMTAEFWTRLLRPAGTQVVSKVTSLVLAAIAVMMIRKGLTGIFAAG